MKQSSLEVASIDEENASLFERKVDLSCFEKYLDKGRLVKIEKGGALRPSKNYFGYIVSGSIQIVLVNKFGTKKIVRVIGPKNLVGDTYFILKREGYESFVAAEDTQVCLFDRACYESVLREDKEVTDALLLWLALHAEALGRQLQEGLDRDPRYKIVRFINNLVRDEGVVNERGNLEFRGKLSHNDIAMHVGVNRVCVSRELEKLKSAGVILFERGRIEILDSKAVKEICDERPQ